jgi:hypothetical protein
MSRRIALVIQLVAFIFTFTMIKNVSKLRVLSIHCSLVIAHRRPIKIDNSDTSVVNEKVILANVAVKYAGTMYRLQCCEGCFAL